MNAIRLKGSRDTYVRLRLPKGVLVVLPMDQYIAGLQRGKAERRAQRFQSQSLSHAEVVYEPQAWSTKAGYYGPRYGCNGS